MMIDVIVTCLQVAMRQVEAGVADLTRASQNEPEDKVGLAHI